MTLDSNAEANGGYTGYIFHICHDCYNFIISPTTNQLNGVDKVSDSESMSQEDLDETILTMCRDNFVFGKKYFDKKVQFNENKTFGCLVDIVNFNVSFNLKSMNISIKILLLYL